MEARLSVLKGSMMGQSFSLAPGQSVLIGRLPECGLSFSSDPTVSRKQCEIEFDPPLCRLKNFSPHKTRVNGQEVEEASLNHGDEIEFGRGNLISLRIPEADTYGTTVLNSGADSIAPRQISCRAADCPTGLLLLTPADAESSFDSISDRLSLVSGRSAVVDFARLKTPVPDEFAAAERLLSWSSAAAIVEQSPVFLTNNDLMDEPSLLQSARGGDALMIVYSRNEPSDVFSHLSALTQYNPTTKSQSNGESCFYYWWPSIAAPLLEHNKPELIAHILEGIDAVLLESDSPDSWKLFGRREFFQDVPELSFAEGARQQS